MEGLQEDIPIPDGFVVSGDGRETGTFPDRAEGPPDSTTSFPANHQIDWNLPSGWLPGGCPCLFRICQDYGIHTGIHTQIFCTSRSL